MIRVSLIKLGQDPELRLARLAKSLNSQQKCLKFSFDGDIANIGAPLYQNKFYDVQQLLGHIKHKHSDATFVVGVTHELMTGDTQDGSTTEDGYFSLSDFTQYAVVTTSMIRWSSPNRTREQYLAYLILCELLNMAAGRDLVHPETSRCIFDDCENRAAFRNAIEAGAICPNCIGKLVDANVDGAIISAAKRILKWVKRRPWPSTLLAIFSNPVASLVAGIAGGWFSAVYLTRVEWAWVLVPSLFVLVGVIIYERVNT
jgi:hypothetical protein